MEKLGDRLRQLVAAKTDDRLRYVQMESTTGISADLWKNFWFARKKADAEMIEAVSRAWPEHALWLATGITDVQFGHLAAVPEATYPEGKPKQGMPASAEYLRASLRARDAAFECLDALNSREDREQPLTINNVQRVLLDKWPHRKDVPELTDALREKMHEFHDRANARIPEVGLEPNLAVIVNMIRYDYNEAKILELLRVYQNEKIERIRKELI